MVLLSLSYVWAAIAGIIFIGVSGFYSVRLLNLKPVPYAIYIAIRSIVLFLLFYYFKPPLSILAVLWLVIVVIEIAEWGRLSKKGMLSRS